MNNCVVITGSNGLLGQNLSRVFSAEPFKLVGVDLQKESVSSQLYAYLRVDLTSESQLEQLFTDYRPVWVVNTAAYTSVDGAEDEPGTASAVNSKVPGHLVGCCDRYDTKLIHISTDYVFSGTRGPYAELDELCANGVYARTKLAGEESIRESSIQWNVVRPNVLYGHGKALKSSFVAWLLGELSAGRKVRIVDDQYNNPTYARRLAELCLRLITGNASGIWHFGSREVVSRFDFALKIADVFGLPSKLVASISTAELKQSAPRPMRSGLICAKVQNELGFRILGIEEELHMLKDEMNVS